MKITRGQLRQIIKEAISEVSSAEERIYSGLKAAHAQELSNVLLALEALGFYERVTSVYSNLQARDATTTRHLDDLVTHNLVTGIMDAALPASHAKEALTKLAGNKQFLEKYIREIEMSSTSDQDTGEHLEDDEALDRAANMLKQAMSSRKQRSSLGL